jgi:putative transposase
MHFSASASRRYSASCRDLIRQCCDSLDVRILKGVVSKDHVHLHLSYPPKLSAGDIVKRIKGRSARLLLDDFSELKRYWGRHLWGIDYGAWSTEISLMK